MELPKNTTPSTKSIVELPNNVDYITGQFTRLANVIEDPNVLGNYLERKVLNALQATGLNIGQVYSKLIQPDINQTQHNDNIEMLRKNTYDSDYILGMKYGTPIYDRWVNLSTTVNGVKKDLLLEIAFITINKSRNYVITPVLGYNNSTIKELTTSGDYNVSIKGMIFSDFAYTRDMFSIRLLKDICESDYITITSSFMQQSIGMDTLIVQSYNVKEDEQWSNGVPFEITCLTDRNIDVITLENTI